MIRALALLLALGGASAAAQEAIPAQSCRGYPGFDSDQVPVAARVLRRSHFHDDRAGCPAGAGCRRKVYLIEGDEVIVDRIAGDWACAWFDGKRRTTIGLLRVDDLALEPAAVEVATAEWLGHWEKIGHDGKSRDFLDIVVRGKVVVVSGEALWFGPMPDNVHTGEIGDEVLDLEEGTASFAARGEYDCAATFRLVGKYLIADDNGHCGGVNVTFDGIYRRVDGAKEKKR